jgi:hypothetical protein
MITNKEIEKHLGYKTIVIEGVLYMLKPVMDYSKPVCIDRKYYWTIKHLAYQYDIRYNTMRHNITYIYKNVKELFDRLEKHHEIYPKNTYLLEAHKLDRFDKLIKYEATDIVKNNIRIWCEEEYDEDSNVSVPLAADKHPSKAL